MALTDKSPTAASVLATSTLSPSRAVVAAGVTIAAGDVVAKNVDKQLILADANGATAYHKIPVGFAVNGAGPGQPVDFVTEDADFTPGFATVAGTPYFLSNTPGKMCTIAADTDLVSGMTVVLLGIGKSATKMNARITIGGAVA